MTIEEAKKAVRDRAQSGIHLPEWTTWFPMGKHPAMDVSGSDAVAAFDRCEITNGKWNTSDPLKTWLMILHDGEDIQIAFQLADYFRVLNVVDCVRTISRLPKGMTATVRDNGSFDTIPEIIFQLSKSSSWPIP
jgi:hypothetical protein